MLIQRIATIFNSTADKENYSFLSEPYEMEEFIDIVQASPLTDPGVTAQTGNDGPGYELKNKTYTGKLCFGRDAMSDAQTNGYSVRIQDAANQAVWLPDSLLIANLIAGTSQNCYLQVGATAEYFFSASHAARGKQSAAWSNLLTGTGTSVAQISTDIGSALAALYKMQSEAGTLMNNTLSKVFILHPAALEVSMRTAVLAAIVSSTSNVGFAPSIELIREPRLDADSAVDYYVGFNDPGIIRGLVWQRREDVRLEEVGEGTSEWSDLRQISYNTSLRGVPGFGKPQRLIKINN
jgi:hypothetical protein